MIQRVWVALGSNLGDSKAILTAAWQELGCYDNINLIRLSHPYQSDPVGMVSDNSFVNAVGLLETVLDPQALLAILQDLEKGFGRARKTGSTGYEDRLLDLDMLYFGEEVLTVPNLVLPHPHIAARLFVLAPLAEIDAGHCHPVHGRSAQEMHQSLIAEIAAGDVSSQEIHREHWN